MNPSSNNANGAMLTRVRYYLWDGNEIVQKRVGGTGSANITTRYFGNGFQSMNTTTGNVSGNYFYTKDQLGSIHEVINTSGNTNTLVGRYDYGPWGETVYMDYSGGTVAQPEFGYAGYFRSQYLPGLYTTKYRIYDPESGRWLSRDPIGEMGGLNLYGYVHNDPINFYDPLGLEEEGYLMGVSSTWYGYVASFTFGVLPIDEENSNMMGGYYTGFGVQVAGAAYGAGKLAVTGIRAGYGAYTAAQLANLSRGQLIALIANDQRALIRLLFGDGTEGAANALKALRCGGKPPPGLTKETLKVYRQIAQKSVDEGIDKLGTQKARIEVIDEILK